MYVAEWVDCSKGVTGPLDSVTWRSDLPPKAAPYGTLVVVREDEVQKHIKAHYSWYEHIQWAVELEPEAAPAIVSAVSGEWRSGRRSRRYEREIESAAESVFPNDASWAADAASRLLFAVQWPEPRFFDFYSPAAVGAGAVARAAELAERDTPEDSITQAADAISAAQVEVKDVRRKLANSFSTATQQRIIRPQRP